MMQGWGGRRHWLWAAPAQMERELVAGCSAAHHSGCALPRGAPCRRACASPVYGSSRFGKRSARSPSAMMMLHRSCALPVLQAAAQGGSPTQAGA